MKKEKKKSLEREMSDTFVLDVKQKSAIALENDSYKSKKKVKKSNKSERDIFDDNKKNKGPLFIILLIIVCLLLGAFSSYYYFLVYNKDSRCTSSSVRVKEKLVMDDVFINELIDRYDIDDGISTYKGLYLKNKLNVSDMNKDYLNYLVIKNALKDLVFNRDISKIDFNKSASNLFNNEVSLKNTDVFYPFDEKNLKVFEYDSDSEVYKQVDIEKNNDYVNLKKKIVNVEKGNDSLDIEVVIYFDDGEKIYNEYDVDNDKLVEVKDIDYDSFNVKKDDKVFSRYKYLFNYSNETNSYYLVSINKV